MLCEKDSCYLQKKNQKQYLKVFRVSHIMLSFKCDAHYLFSNGSTYFCFNMIDVCLSDSQESQLNTQRSVFKNNFVTLNNLSLSYQ